MEPQNKRLKKKLPFLFNCFSSFLGRPLEGADGSAFANATTRQALVKHVDGTKQVGQVYIMNLLCKSGSEGRFKGGVVAVSCCKRCALKAAYDKSAFIGCAERRGCATGKAKGWAGVIQSDRRERPR